jgi:hypothetical protein
MAEFVTVNYGQPTVTSFVIVRYGMQCVILPQSVRKASLAGNVCHQEIAYYDTLSWMTFPSPTQGKAIVRITVGVFEGIKVITVRMSVCG